MKELFGKRLRELRENKGLSQADLGKLFNLSKQAISSYETGGSLPPPETLQKFADFFNVSVDYLLGRTDDPNLDKTGSGRQIRFFSTIKAGVNVVEAIPEGWIEIPADVEADFAARVEGDSMLWAGLHPGDIVICRDATWLKVRHGQMVAACLEQDDWGIIVKYYVEYGGKRWLRSANPGPEYKDILLDDKPHRIAGIVVKILKDPPAMKVYESMIASYQGLADWSEVIGEARALGLGPEEVLEYLNLVRRHKDK
jgi:repressor LexA